mgnify:CR=1 FL=1
MRDDERVRTRPQVLYLRYSFEGERANAKVVLGGFGAPAGSRVQVGLFFAKAGVVTLDAIVREASEEYAGITAGETLPTPTPSPTATK